MGTRNNWGPRAPSNDIPSSTLRANDLDRGLGKVRLYADSALSPQHKNREGETQASGVADTADETETRSKRFYIIYLPTSNAIYILKYDGCQSAISII